MTQKLTPKRNESGEWKPSFISTLAKTANVRLACQAADVSRPVAYKHRKEDPEFAAAWADAMEDACDHLEEVARQRAIGISDTLMIFLLKAHRPEKFRDNHKIEIGGSLSVEIIEEVLESPIAIEAGEADRSPAPHPG